MVASIRVIPSWAWLGFGLIVIGGLSTISAGPSGGSRPLQAASAQPDGALALNLWLARSGYHVTISSGLPQFGSVPAAGTTAMLLASGSDVPRSTVAGVLGWLRRGGRLVIASAGETGKNVLNAIGLAILRRHSAGIRVTQPLMLSPPVATLAGGAPAVLASSDDGAEVAAGTAGPVLLIRRYGRGMVWVLTAPSLLDNLHIALGTNRKLALNLAGPRYGSVSFDEYIPPVPVEAGGSWLTTTAWGVAVIFAVCILVLYRWLSGLRLGPAIVPLAEGHRAATEYVVSLAGLLRRGRGQEEVLRTFQLGLRRELLRRYGDQARMIAPRERERLDALLTPMSKLSEGDLVRQVKAIVEAEESMRKTRE